MESRRNDVLGCTNGVERGTRIVLDGGPAGRKIKNRAPRSPAAFSSSPGGAFYYGCDPRWRSMAVPRLSGTARLETQAGQERNGMQDEGARSTTRQSRPRRISFVMLSLDYWRITAESPKAKKANIRQIESQQGERSRGCN